MSLQDGTTGVSTALAAGTFHVLTADPDLQGIVNVLNGLQQNALASTHILYKYPDLVNRVKDGT